jgi:hypothetical protein
MKWKSFYSIIFFLASQLLFFAQTPKSNTRNSSLLPLKIGNYWVYSSSQAPDKKDTIKITRNRIIGSDTCYYFKQSLMLVKNDTVFEFQLQGNGNPVVSIQYFPAVDMNYTILVGGDAIAGRSVKRLKAPYKVNGKEYLNCYEFSDKLFNKTTIFAAGVGIIEMRYPDQTIFLVGYKIN